MTEELSRSKHSRDVLTTGHPPEEKTGPLDQNTAWYFLDQMSYTKVLGEDGQFSNDFLRAIEKLDNAHREIKGKPKEVIQFAADLRYDEQAESKIAFMIFSFVFYMLGLIGIVFTIWSQSLGVLHAAGFEVVVSDFLGFMDR